MGDFQHGVENPLAQASAGAGEPESWGCRAPVPGDQGLAQPAGGK